jgi:exodeoxyribonuclease V gamma subunit
VRLTERPATERNPLAEGLAAVLDFARGRWPASGLVELLHLRAARRHLGILDDDKALGQLRAWIKASGLTEEPASERAWRAARDRLLAGFWFGPDTLTRYPSSEYALPVSGDLEGVDPLRAAFLLWHSRLEELLRAWKPPATPAAWAGRLWQACEVLFSGDESEDDLPELSRMLDPLAAQACDTLVDCGTLLDWMTLQSEGHSAARSSFTGEITFGRFVQLQNQPCRVLAMVGMQEGAFPRQSRTPAWDLLQLEPRLWDRNPRIEDRQLFLDALLCPTDRLIITAGVQNLRSGKEEPFSACVDELLRVAAATMRLEPGERELEQDRLIFRHRLQPFSAAYFSEGSRLPRSFSNDQLAIAEAVATPGRREGSKPFFDAATAPAPQAPAELSLDALIAFWKDPARGWLTAQGITLPRDEEDEQEWDRPPLSVNGLQAWGVRQRILDEALLGSKAPTRLLLTADRQLPPGALGENAWTNLHTGAQQIAREVLALKPVRVPVDLVVPVARDRSLRLTGSLCQGEDQGVPRLVSYSPGKMDTQKAGLAAWLQALAAAAAGLKAPSLLIGEELYTKGKRFDAPAIPKQEALLGLASLVKGFLEGGDRPLCYAPATSERYAASLEEGFIFDPDRLRAAAESLWSPEGGYVSGEGLTPAAQLAWRDQDPFSIDGEPCLAEAWHAWAECIALPLLQWRKSPKDPHA